MHAYTRNDHGRCGQFHVRTHAFESRSGFYSQALTCFALLLSSVVGARSIMSLTRLGLISSETFLSVRSKRSKGCTHTREMIMVAAVSFMFARTRLRLGLASI